MDITNPFRTRPAVLARLPRIVRLYILNCLFGFALAGVFTAAVVWLNIANIGHLVTHAPGGFLALAVFFVLNGIVFAGVQTGIVIMTISYDDTPKPPRGRRQPVAVPATQRP